MKSLNIYRVKQVKSIEKRGKPAKNKFKIKEGHLGTEVNYVTQNLKFVAFSTMFFF
jgi:hypothetical protein